MTADDPDQAPETAATGHADPDGQADSRCWNCDAPLPEGAMFCGECGSAVGARAPRPAEEDATPAEDPAEPGDAQPSPGQDEAGTPPHGDALIEEPTHGHGDAAPTPEDHQPLSRQDGEASPQRSADSNEAGTPPHGDALIESPAEDAAGTEGDGEHAAEPADDAPDSAPTEVQPVLEHSDGADMLAPLTPEERFAAERLLDPDSPAEKFVLQFSTGESATVYGSGLVGRNPVAEPGEYVDHLVVIRDPGRSVSKTHLEFGQENGAFWVLDRFSGNGSALRVPDGAPKRCEPGRRYFVPRGTRIEIGDQFLVVS